MTTLVFAIFVGLLGTACAGGVYSDYRKGCVPKWVTIPFMAVFIILGTISFIAAVMLAIT